MYKNLIWMVFLAIGLVTISSCKDENDVMKPEIEKTLLEIHQANLQSISVDGDQLSYLDYGDSNEKVIILLHGAPTSSFLFRNIASELADQTDFRVIAPDFLGFGESDKPTTTGAYTAGSQATRVFAFADALGIDNFVLGVHDIGGYIGWTMLVSNQKDRISGLLITDTSLGQDGFNPPALVAPIFAGQATPRPLFESAMVDEITARGNIDIAMRDGIFNESLVTDELIDAYASSFTQPETYIQLFESFGNAGTLISMVFDEFSQFEKPAAILWGGEDVILDADVIPAIFQSSLNVPEEYVKILDNAGHYLQEDAPEEYVNFVSSFLNSEF